MQKTITYDYKSTQIRFAFIYVMLVSVFISCGKRKSDQEIASEFISSDLSKIGIEVTDQELGITFHPPQKWELKQTSISHKVESRGTAVKPSDNFIYQPTYVFFNDSLGGLLSVGKVITNDTTLAKSTRLNFYKGLISTKYKNEKLSIGNFINSKISFYQFTIQKENLISFKILFENIHGDIIQLDYTIPSNYLEGTRPYIKSSIGSIKLL